MRLVAILLGASILGPASGRAALFRLRGQCQSQAPVVTLGDVAEILTADRQQAETLAAIELVPAPLPPRHRYLRVREIQDLLFSRGVNPAEHRFSGSSRVVILGSREPADGPREVPLSLSLKKAADRRVRQAVVEYLQGRASADAAWVVQAQLDQSRARLVADPDRTISITGGAPPWTGPQRFQVTVETQDGPVRFPLDARVATAPPVVVAARPLSRGTRIRRADVRLQHGAACLGRSEEFHSIDEVVGKQTTRAIAKAKVIQRESVRLPLAVRRGEVVTVYARSPGICVRTVGRARADGSLGDLVPVESLLDRSKYFARVSNLREVEVYARSPKASAAGTGGRSRLGAR